jgi:hypothetical protein
MATFENTGGWIISCHVLFERPISETETRAAYDALRTIPDNAHEDSGLRCFWIGLYDPYLREGESLGMILIFRNRLDAQAFRESDAWVSAIDMLQRVASWTITELPKTLIFGDFG